MPTKAELQAQIKDLQAKLATCQAKVTDLSVKLNAAQAQVSTLTEEKRVLQQNLDEANAEIITLNSQISTLKTKIVSLQAELDAANIEINRLVAVVGNKNTEIAALNSQVLTLQAEIQRLKDKYEPTTPPPPPPSGSRFGVTVTGPVRQQYTDLHPKVKSSRVYWQSMSSSWANEPQHKAFPDSKWAVSCSESIAGTGTRAERMDAALKTIPVGDKANIMAFCDTHEPEDNTGLTAATHKQHQMETAPVIRAHGLRVASCLMGWTLAPASGRDWRDYIDPDSIDLLAWDKYNSGAKKTPPIYQTPVDLLAPILDVSQELGKPWALWETGTDRFGTDYDRAVWTEKLHNLIIAEGGEAAIWFDRQSTSGSDWDASLDRLSAEKWLA